MKLHRNNWLDIFAGFRVAFSLKKILLGTACLYVTILILLGLLYIAGQWWPEARAHFDVLLSNPAYGAPRLVSVLASEAWGLIARKGMTPQGDFAFGPIGFAAGSAVLLLIVWSFFYGPICRMAAVEFATDEKVSLNDGFSFATKRFGSFFWSPVVPFIFAAIMLLCASVVGLVGRIPVVGPPLMGIFFCVAVFIAAIALIVVIATVFGFSFMWPTIAVEGTNSFDAISRSFNYILARPWKTLWCWLVAIVYNAVLIAFVAGFAWLMLKLATACIAFGMGTDNFAPIQSYLGEMRIAPGTPAELVIGSFLIKVVYILVAGLACGFAVSCDATACTIIYFVIRRDVDGTEMPEVFLPEPQEDVLPEPLPADETKTPGQAESSEEGPSSQ